MPPCSQTRLYALPALIQRPQDLPSPKLSWVQLARGAYILKLLRGIAPFLSQQAQHVHGWALLGPDLAYWPEGLEVRLSPKKGVC